MSNFLFAQPSFVSGMARSLDLWATFDAYNVSRTTELADARALYLDWAAVGQELLTASKELAQGAVEPVSSTDCGRGGKA